jgi:hypothetical protein
MIDFSRSLKAFGTDQFEGVLTEELSDLGLDDLPLEEGCDSGGFPEEPEILNVGEPDESDSSITVTFDVSFTECLQTGCSECPVEVPQQISCRVDISKETGMATVQFDEACYDDE